MKTHISQLIMVLITVIINTAFGQKPDGVYIGQQADRVEAFVSTEVQAHYNAQGYLVKMNAQTIDYKGKPKEIILSKENVLIGLFNKGVKLSIHYIIEADTVSKIITEYKNLSMEEVKVVMLSDRNLTNIGGYYFEHNYNYYHQIVLGTNGSVFDNYKKTQRENLPSNVSEQLKMLEQKWE